MNAKSALIKELLDGKTITIMTCFRTIGLTNLPREISRMVEQPFGVIVSRTRKEGKSRYGSDITWFEYRLNKTDYNREGIQKMRDYLAENLDEYRPKQREEIYNDEQPKKFVQPELF